MDDSCDPAGPSRTHASRDPDLLIWVDSPYQKFQKKNQPSVLEIVDYARVIPVSSWSTLIKSRKKSSSVIFLLA